MWAHNHSFDYHPEEDPSLWMRFGAFRCLQVGDQNHGYNMMYGTFGGRRVHAFDYHCEHLAPGDDAVVSSDFPLGDFSAVIVEAGMPLWALLIRPAGSLHEVAETVGLEDINFESISFNKKYRVKCPDPRWAFTVLNQRTIELMLKHPAFAIDFEGNQVMARWESTRFAPKDFESALTVAVGMLDNLPPDVVRELKETASGGEVS